MICNTSSSTTATHFNRDISQQFSVISFLKAVIRPAGAAIELRAIKGNAVVVRIFCRNSREIDQFVSQHHECHLHYGGAARRADATDGTLASCQHLSSLYTDIDFKVVAESVAEASLRGFIFPPSAVVLSGGGLHLYWFLNQPFILPQQAANAKALLR